LLEKARLLIEAIERFSLARQRILKQRAMEEAEVEIKMIMRDYFKRQGRLFLQQFAKLEKEFPIEEAVNPGDIDDIMEFVGAQTADDLQIALKAPIGAILAKAASNMLEIAGADNIDIAWNLKNPAAVKWVESHGAELVAGIDETTRSAMSDLLTRAVEEGWSYGHTAREIKSNFDGFAGLKPQGHIHNRAEGVAVTESRFAYEQGNLRTAEALRDLGLNMEKSWYVSGDEMQCEDCELNGDEGWIPLDDNFPSGDDAPPAHPYCRCDLLIQRVGAGEYGD